MTKVTPAQQKVIDGLKAGRHLSLHHTKYSNGTDLYDAGGFSGERRGIPAKTILALVEKGLICESSRDKWSSITSSIVYQLCEAKQCSKFVHRDVMNVSLAPIRSLIRKENRREFFETLLDRKTLL